MIRMRQKSVVFLLMLALSGSVHAAVTETQPQVSIAPPLQAAPQAAKLTKLTPEQEAALIEVRKILLEARQVAVPKSCSRSTRTSRTASSASRLIDGPFYANELPDRRALKDQNFEVERMTA